MRLVLDRSCSLVLLAFVCILAGLLQHSIAAAAPTLDDPSARDLQRLVAWYEGEFDNQEQVWFENNRRSVVPVAERHERMHLIRHRVDLPTFGRYVFYTEDYRDDNPRKAFRQRVVTFESAGQSGVRMKLWFPKDPQTLVGAYDDPARLARITRDDVIEIEGCDVYWVLEGDQYVGRMKPGACIFGEAAERRYSQFDVIQSATRYSRLDSTFLVDSDRQFSGPPSGVPAKFLRAYKFWCDLKFYAGDGLAGPRPIEEEFPSQIIHSQGGAITVHRKSDSKEYVFKLQGREHPYLERNSDFLYLSVHTGNEPTIAYSIHDSDATLIGFSLGWMSAFCERDSRAARDGRGIAVGNATHRDDMSRGLAKNIPIFSAEPMAAILTPAASISHNGARLLPRRK